MANEIVLRAELPDGQVVVSRRMPRELGLAPELAPPPEYLSWLCTELPDAVAQLYTRAGLPDPLTVPYDALPVGVPRTPDTLAAFVTGLDAARVALHATAAALGIDPVGQPVDVRTGLMAKAHRLADVAADRVRQQASDRELAGRYSLYLTQIHNQLSAAPVLERDVPDLVEATLRDLREEVDQRGVILDRVKSAAGLRAEDDVADIDLPTMVGNLTRSDAAETLNRVLIALGMEAIANPAQELVKREERAVRGALNEVLIMFGLECDDDEEPMSKLADMLATERQRSRDEAVQIMLTAFGVSFKQWGDDPVTGLRNKFSSEIEAERRGAGIQGAQESTRKLNVVLAHVAAVAASLSVGSPMQRAALTQGEFTMDDLVSFVNETQKALWDMRSAHASETAMVQEEFASIRRERDTMRQRAEESGRALDAVSKVLAGLASLTAIGPDVDLAVLIRRVVLGERYPIGSPVKTYSEDAPPVMREATVRAVSVTSPDNDPIMVLFADGTRETLPVSRVARPGEFLNGDGQRGRAFRLPENGLKDILSGPSALKTVDDVIGELSDRLTGFGDRVVAKLDELSAKAAAKLDEHKGGEH